MQKKKFMSEFCILLTVRKSWYYIIHFYQLVVISGGGPSDRFQGSTFRLRCVTHFYAAFPFQLVLIGIYIYLFGDVLKEISQCSVIVETQNICRLNQMDR